MTAVLGGFLCPPGYAGPTGLRAIAREGTAVVEGARLALRVATDRVGRAVREPAAGAAASLAPVVLVPGFLAGDAALLPLSARLRRCGFRTYRSAMHANVGCAQEAADTLEQRIEAISGRWQRKVSIVGHSLGGLLARSIAARRPDLVAGIVTLGSPMLAPGAVHPVLAFDLAVVTALRRLGLDSVMGVDCTSGECARLSWAAFQRPLPDGVAFTSVFSRRDGIIDWRSCLDPAAEQVEVRTSHLGMAVDPRVHDTVVAALGTSAPARSGAQAPDGPPLAPCSKSIAE